MHVDAEKIIKELVSLDSEFELVEFKEAKTDFHFDEIGRYFSALANEANLARASYAWLVFGVRDKDHRFVNSLYRKNGRTLQSLKKEITQHTTNNIGFINIYSFDAEPGKRVVMFQIPAAPLGIPVAFKGVYYARNHESLVPLDISKLERIRAERPEKDWSAQIVSDAKLSDLSSEAIKIAREQYKIKNSDLIGDVDAWDDKTFLNKAKLTIRGKVTNTALLLLGRPESATLLAPAVAKMTWILRDSDGMELDYEHFTCPFIITAEQLYKKIRNLKYRYMKEGSLFPEEVSTYEPYVIREALNNCIAHQDYSKGGRINVVESEDSRLVFTNLGSFLPGTVESVIASDAPSEYYRNQFLSDAMVNLNMIDTVGSGIKKMFLSQKSRFFPMPEYDLRNDEVKVTIIGKILDINYARKLAQIPDLSLQIIMLLDKVQKHKPLSELESKQLRDAGLIEGRRPNIYISSSVANELDSQIEYMNARGIENNYIENQIIEYLSKFNKCHRKIIDRLLMPKLSSGLTDKQKKDKIKNSLQKLKKNNVIDIDRKTGEWFYRSK